MCQAADLELIRKAAAASEEARLASANVKNVELARVMVEPNGNPSDGSSLLHMLKRMMHDEARRTLQKLPLADVIAVSKSLPPTAWERMSWPARLSAVQSRPKRAEASRLELALILDQAIFDTLDTDKSSTIEWAELTAKLTTTQAAAGGTWPWQRAPETPPLSEAELSAFKATLGDSAGTPLTREEWRAKWIEFRSDTGFAEWATKWGVNQDKGYGLLAEVRSGVAVSKWAALSPAERFVLTRHALVAAGESLVDPNVKRQVEGEAATSLQRATEEAAAIGSDALTRLVFQVIDA